MYAATYGRIGPSVHLLIRDRAYRRVAGGELARGWHEPRLVVAVAPAIERPLEGATLCVRFGPGGHVALAGDVHLGPGGSTQGRPRPGRFRISYGTGQRASLIAIRSDVARRYPRATSRWLGVWTLWAIVAAVVLAAALAGFALTRDLRR
jgi:hypothetical protein